MRSSMTCKAGLASSFFEDETCWISACIVLISFSEDGIIGTYDSQADDLRAREASLVSNMRALRSPIESLELRTLEWDKKRASYTETKERTQELEGLGGGLQKQWKLILDELLQARMLLSNLIQAIAVALSDCRYARTRREIAGGVG